MKRIRLDKLLVDRELVTDLEQARRLIMAGHVRVSGLGLVTAETPLDPMVDVYVDHPQEYVSRGGQKLAGALDVFDVLVKDRVAADVGASTGGFTDCLLQHGAARVYAIDVGYGQLAWSIRIDPRVVVMDRTNARHVQRLDEPVDLVVIDASFISLKTLLPAIGGWYSTNGGDLVALIKPQFEAERRLAGDGVIRETETHRTVLKNTISWAVKAGWQYNGLCRSPIKGPKGNIEFLVWLRWGLSGRSDWLADIDRVLMEGGSESV